MLCSRSVGRADGRAREARLCNTAICRNSQIPAVGPRLLKEKMLPGNNSKLSVSALVSPGLAWEARPEASELAGEAALGDSGPACGLRRRGWAAVAGGGSGREGPAPRSSPVPAAPPCLSRVWQRALSEALPAGDQAQGRGSEQATTSQGPAQKRGPL